MQNLIPCQFPQTERQLRASYRFHRIGGAITLVLAIMNFTAASLIPDDGSLFFMTAIIIGLICLMTAISHLREASRCKNLHARYFPSLALK